MILAFLQNQWFNNPDRIKQILSRYTEGSDDYWRQYDIIATYALFAGCMTGKRLRAGLGEDVCDQIHWSNASPVMTRRASDKPPADLEHMMATLRRVQPKIVLAFGEVAGEAIKAVWLGPTLFAPHPAARMDVIGPMKVIADKLQRGGYLESTNLS